MFGPFTEDSEVEAPQLRILRGVLSDRSKRERMEYEARQGRQDIMASLELFEKLTFNEVKVKSAIYALAALGDPSTRERLEYLEGRGSETIRKAAKAALEHFGRGTYDEIKAKAEPS